VNGAARSAAKIYMNTKNCLVYSGALRVGGALAAAALSVSASAQDSSSALGNPSTRAWLENPSAPSVRASVNYSYDTPASAKFQGAGLAKSDVNGLVLGVDSRLKVNDDWFVPLGLQSDNYYLGSVTGAPIPDAIHTLHIRTGLGWRMNGQWTFTGLVGAALYRLDDLHSDDVGFTGGVLASYQQRANLSWTFGILASPDSDLPVLPVVGVHWGISDQFTLDVGVPRTRLTYQLDPQWSFFTGLDLTGTTFRGSESLGAKPGYSGYNNALATYRDIRVGVGSSYEFAHGLRVEGEVGYSVYHRIDYTTFDQSVHFDPAPYVRVGVSYRF
jgi:hypothetical protein